MHVFASDDTIRKGAKLGSVAMQLRKRADEAEILVKALRKIKDDHHQSVQTLKRQLDDALQAEMTVPWKAANDSTEAFNMALKSAEDAQKAAVKAAVKAAKRIGSGTPPRNGPDRQHHRGRDRQRPVAQGRRWILL